MRDISGYSAGIAELPAFDQVREDGYGPGYGEVESHLLYMMVRHFKPSLVVEVGSGISTFYTIQGLSANRAQDNVKSRLVCIEPYPNGKLRGLASAQDVELRESEVQDTLLSVFDELASGDILFIDSSHVSKKDSDVEFLYLEVLPRLREGVIIHIHDILLPMPAPPTTHPLFDTFLFWNEMALVRAFLLFNSAFEVIMCQSYLHSKHPEVLAQALPRYSRDKDCPGSLWLRRIR